MTRKDYVAIAAAIQRAASVDVPHLPTAHRIALNVADVMAADNPRFDRARFLAACGVQS